MALIFVNLFKVHQQMVEGEDVQFRFPRQFHIWDHKHMLTKKKMLHERVMMEIVTICHFISSLPAGRYFLQNQASSKTSQIGLPQISYKIDSQK